MLLDDEATTNLWCGAAQLLASGKVSSGIAKGLQVGRLTALSETTAERTKVRGIVTGSAHRRLVAKTLAQQSADTFDKETSPFQFALSTRAGTDALSHFLRATTQLDENKVVVAIDGVGAFDHIKRKAIFQKLLEVP